MRPLSRRQFLTLSTLTAAAAGLVAGSSRLHALDWLAPADAQAEPSGPPIKIGIIDPLSSPYKTSSIHDVHGATVALEAFNKRGGVLGRPVTLIEVDDGSNVETATRAAMKLIQDDHVDVLMGTFNGDVALAVGELAQRHDKLFMVTGAHVPELTGANCRKHVFVFMPNAIMLAQAVA